MKKLIALTLFISSLLSLSAAFIPFVSRDTSPLFSSPWRALEGDVDTPFMIELDMGSSINALTFLSSPLSVTEKASEDLVYTLEKKDLDWWRDNGEVASVFSSFDSSFPTPSFNKGEEELEEWRIRKYLTSTFLSSQYTKERRAYVLSALSGNKELFSKSIYGETDLFLSFSGEKVEDGFGWGWSFSLGFDGSEKLFGGGNSIFSLTLSTPVSYAFPISESLECGISAIPRLRMETYILPSSFTLSRLQGNVVSLFSEDFRFGLGIELNAGLRYTVSDELFFSLDGRNIPSFFTYSSISLDNMASFDLDFQRVKDTWVELPDVAFAAHWRREGHRVEVEMDRIVSQLLYSKEVDDYSFDFLLCPNIRYSYFFDKNESLSLNLSTRMLELNLYWDGFSFSLSYGYGKNNIGIKMGYRIISD